MTGQEGGKNILRDIFHLKRLGHPLAGLGRAPTHRPNPIDLLQAAGGLGPLRLGKLQPRNGRLALQADGGIGRGGAARVLLDADAASAAAREVEEGHALGVEVVNAGDGEGRGPQLGDGPVAEAGVGGGGGEGERGGVVGDGEGGQGLEEVWVRGGEAGCVEEGCYGAGGRGGCRCVGTGVVLGAAA